MALEPQITVPDLDTSSAMSRDPTHRLTPRAREIFRELSRRRQRAHDLWRPASQRAEDARTDFRRGQRAYEEMERVYRSGRLVRVEDRPVEFMKRSHEGERGPVVARRRVEPDDKRMQAEKAKLDALRAAWEDLAHERDVLSREFQELAGCCTDIEAWLKGLGRGVKLVDWSGPEPKAKKTESFIDAVVRLEAEVHHLRQRVKAIEASPVSGEEAKAAILEYSRKLADIGRPDVSAVLAGHGPEEIRWTRESLGIRAVVSDEQQTAVAGGVSATDPLALAIWLNPEAVASRLCDEVDELDTGDGLTSEERAAALAEANAALLTTERAWAHFLAEAEARGEGGMRRRVISPLAVLRLEIVEGGKR